MLLWDAEREAIALVTTQGSFQALPGWSQALAQHRMCLCVPVPTAVLEKEIPPHGLSDCEGHKAICSLRYACCKPINIKSLY